MGYRLKTGDGIGSLLLGVYDEVGRMHFHVGHTSAFKAAERREIPSASDRSRPRWRRRSRRLGGPRGSGTRPDGRRPSRWSRGREAEFVPLEPALVVEVTYDYLQGDRFRHAAGFVRWRTDKEPREAFEQPRSGGAGGRTMRLAGKVAADHGGTSGIGRQRGPVRARRRRRRPPAATSIAAHRSSVRSRTRRPRPVRPRSRRRRLPSLVETTTEVLGRLDVLFNAGVYLAGDVTECTEDEWDLQVDVSLKGTYSMCASVVPVMIAQGGGSIVNSSGLGARHGERAVERNAAKGGVVLMTKAMALDHGRDGSAESVSAPATR